MTPFQKIQLAFGGLISIAGLTVLGIALFPISLPALGVGVGLIGTGVSVAGFSNTVKTAIENATSGTANSPQK